MAKNKLNFVISAVDKTKQAFGQLSRRLSGLKNSIFSVQTAFIGLGGGLVARNLIKTGNEIEGLQVRLKFLFGSLEEGNRAFQEMTKFASQVPFSLEEIQAGSGNLAVVTENADELAKMLKITGNVASITGLDFKTTAEQIQRSFSAGIGAADLFRDRGVRAMLGFEAGVKVSIEDTVKAFERLFGEGGEFDGATDDLAKTFTGTLSMIGDKVFNFKRVLLEAGLFEELKNQFGDLDKFLEDNAQKLDQIATSVGKNLAQAIVGTVKVGQKLLPFLAKVKDALMGLINTFNSLPQVFQSAGIIGAFLLGKKGFVGLALILGAIKKAEDFANKFGKKKVDNVNFEHELSIVSEKTLQLEKERKKAIDESTKAIERAKIKKAEEHEAFLRTQQPIHDFQHELSVAIENNSKKQITMVDRLKDRVERLSDASESFGDTISLGFEKAVFEGGKLRETIRNISSDLLRLTFRKTITEPASEGISSFLKDIFKGITGKASGGSVTANKPYMVGERGAELFVPNSSGSIIPNHQLSSGSVQVVQNINVMPSVVDSVRSEILNALPLIREQSVQAVIEARSRGGITTKALGLKA